MESRRNSENTVRRRRTSSKDSVTIIITAITVLGSVVGAYFAFRGSTAPVELAINATQVSETRVAVKASASVITQTPIVEPPTTEPPTTEPPTAEPPSPTPLTVVSDVSTIKYALPKAEDISNLPSITEGLYYRNPTTPTVNAYQVDVKASLSYVWKFNWCAYNGSYLKDNLQFINLNFRIGDTEIPSDNIYIYNTSQGGWECQEWVTLLSGWTRGEKVNLTIKYLISTKIFDGKDRYEPGEYFHQIAIFVQ